MNRRVSVGVVIVHFHREADAAELASLLIRGEGIPADQVVIADNGSAPEALAEELAVRECDPVVLSLANAGFAAAMNSGVRALPGGVDTLLLLSHEVRFGPGAVNMLVSRATADPRSIVGPLLLLDNDTVWSAGGELSRVRQIPRHRHGNESPRDLGEAPLDAEWLDGSVVATSRAFFDELAGLDERFFLYGEDIDLALRARASGGSVHVIPAARAFQSPSPEIDPYLWTRNLLLLFKANRRRMPALLWVMSCLMGISRDLVLRRPNARLARRWMALRHGLLGAGGPPPPVEDEGESEQGATPFA